jgi:hypothetical protein
MAPDAAPVDSMNERLVELKNKNDPTNLCRLNQNIKPSVWRHSEGGAHDRLTQAQ